MVGPAQRNASANVLADEVMDVVADHGELDTGELVIHFDLVVETRRIDDTGHEHIRRHHWSPNGSTPHLSYGVLAAEAQRILRKLSGGERGPC